ncbi:hypothetical protein ACWGCP_32725, partial [Streptomyces niveus]
MRILLSFGSVLLAVVATVAAGPVATAGTSVPLPERMADTGGGGQLITAEAASTGATTGRVTWWDRRGDRWVAAGSADARFGAGGLVPGGEREQG